VMIDKIYTLGTQGERLAFAYVRGGDEISIGTHRVKGNEAWDHIIMRGSKATNVYIRGPQMVTAASFPDTSGFLYKLTAGEGATFASPSATFIDGEILPADNVPGFYIVKNLANGQTATAWRFTVNQRRGLMLDIWAQIDVSGKGAVMMHRRLLVTKPSNAGD